MKKRKTIFTSFLPVILVVLSQFASGQKISCKLSFDGNTPMIDGRTNAASARPGDTICLTGNFQYMRISYLHGSREAPIVIINQGSQVLISGFYYGLKLDSCSYLKFSGNGNQSVKYGIKLYNISGFGISIEGLSSDIEIENIEISNTITAGIYAKSDIDTSFTSTRDKYTFRNLSIHDCYIHNTGMEGMYIGSSFYSGVEIQYHGKDTLVYPHLLKGVRIYNNKVEHTGWDGIQVASADSGCNVFRNAIGYDSDSAYWFQMTGIQLGDGSACDCYNNTIKNGKGDGIDLFGLGGQKIYNNLIINAGRSYCPDSAGYILTKHGIFRGQATTNSGTSDLIAYNTVISPRNFGITYSNYITKNSLAADNIITDPGSYPVYGQMAFVRLMDPQMELIDENNLKLLNTADVQFVNPGLLNFDLLKTSPAVNSAKDIPGLPLEFDLENRSRPFSIRNDIGAYECHDSSLLGINEKYTIPDEFTIISIVTRRQEAEIQYRADVPLQLAITLVNASGMVVKDTSQLVSVPGIYSISLGEHKLRPGLYLCSFSTKTWKVSKKFIID